MTLGWSVWARLLRWLISTAGLVAGFYLLTWRWDLPWLWATAAVASLVTLAMALTIDPDLARERRRPCPGGVDRLSQAALSVFMGAQTILAGLDVGRLHWSDTVPPVLRAVALLLFGAGFGLVVWSLAVNRFFSPVVRVQSDRGHAVVTSGPYHYVRHPGYIGMLMSYGMVAPAIGSWWGLLPGGLSLLVVLRRAVLEDAYLLKNLPGYREYAAAVPARLIPGVW